MESIVEKHSNQIKVYEKEKIALYQDLKNSELRIEKQNKIISTLEGMKTQLLNDIKDLTRKVKLKFKQLHSTYILYLNISLLVIKFIGSDFININYKQVQFIKYLTSF